MPAFVLEVNDAGLLVLPEGAVRPLPEAPGVAVVEGEGRVVTGAAAAARAQLRPRETRDDFWDRLDAEPLGPPFPDGLSRADLAYEQLVALRDASPASEAGVLAVPGHWPVEALGLLLSIARAAGFVVRGLVDAGVAAACFAPRRPRLLHLDLTRHRAVLTEVDGARGSTRLRVADVPGLGVGAFDRAYADHVARRFVRETRYDPRHSAPADQALHDRLPEWLRELRSLPSCPALLAAGGREHRIDIDLGDFARAGADLHGRLAERLRAEAKGADGPAPLLLLSARVTRQPGLADHLRAATGLESFDLPYDAAVLGAMRHRAKIQAADPLPFVTRLPAWDGAAAPNPGPPSPVDRP